MFKIMNSFADCSSCELLEAPSCILETNSKADLSQVDLVVISENPGKDEIKKGVPLIGRAGQTFRKPFEYYIKKKCKYLLTNCVLCLTLDENGNTGNPLDTTIERCKVNCFNIVKQCSPKLIILMGTSPMKAFGIAKSGITNLRGQLFKWEGFDVLVTVHPSFVNRNRTYQADFENDIKLAAELVLGESVSTSKKVINTEKLEKGIFRYQIPKKFYTEEYRLVDIQFINKGSKILYIFRDKDNNKVFHEENDKYVYYTCPEGVKAEKIVPYESLYQTTISYRQKARVDPNTSYEGDMKLTAKHAIDYYHYNQGEAPRQSMNIMFCDIEIDTGIDNKAFPQPKDALYPINMITSIFQSPRKTICYVLDNNTDSIKDIEGVELKIFKTEKKMLIQFIKDWKKYDPDFASGWNFISFDMEYIFNRLPRLKIAQGSLSRFGEFYVDSFRFACNLPGCIILDQDHLYKSFTFTKMENYKLGFIAQHELGVSKVDMPMAINEMYWKDINGLIGYNIQDSILLERLEEKLKHINLLNELRVICNASFDSAASGFGQIDCTMVSFLKSKNLASKNSDPHVIKGKYPGAYVQSPEPGIYENITDFDFTSLYPSIIMTYNIGVNNFIMKTVDRAIGYDLVYNPKALPDEIDLIIDPMFEAKPLQISKSDLFEMIKKENLIHTINGCFYKTHNDEISVYSLVLENLLSSRRSYKKKMLDAKESQDVDSKDFYNTKQLVYKVLANTLYGVVANNAFRFFNLDCAASITLGGQEALKHAIIYGEQFMKHLRYNKPLEEPNFLTKQEMYGDAMPNRKFEYIITGDTDSIFTRWEEFPGKKTFDQIMDWCAKLQYFLNEEIMKKIVISHNVNFENNKLDLKNELLISRGLFLAKKYYAIHVTGQEGKKVDEVIYMGISVKRSDTPSATKEFLKELLDLVLKSEKVNITKLIKFVDSKKNYFRDLIKEGSKTIAKPAGINRPLDQYKSITQAVKGAQTFNDISYNGHYVGSRGYLYHISGVDLSKAPPEVVDNYNKNIEAKGKKVEVVLLPSEENKLPEYYIPNIKMQLAKSFTDRYNLILGPLLATQSKKGVLTI